MSGVYFPNKPLHEKDISLIKTLLINIVGVLTPKSFILETLFPYSCEHMADFLIRHQNNIAVQLEVNKLKKELEVEGDPETLAKHFVARIQNNDLPVSLRSLQAFLWEEAYQKEVFLGFVCEDAIKKLQQWKRQGIKIFNFSTGVSQAQKGLFTYTQMGDITYLFSGYYDSRMGSKRQSRTFEFLVEEFGNSPSQVLYLSIVSAELDAAKQAGLHTCCVTAGEDANQIDHPVVSGVDKIDLDDFNADN